MLGTILISGLLLRSPDTVGFTLVPKHTVYLDRTFNSFNEIVKAREGIYDLGVGSINIPLASDSLQLAVIVYGSERARDLQLKRVETFLNRPLKLSSGGFTYFGTPYGGPHMVSPFTQIALHDDSVGTYLDRAEVALDSMLAAERGSELKGILEPNQRLLPLEQNTDLNTLLDQDDKDKNQLLVLRQDSLEALLNRPVTLNNSSQSALDVLSNNSESALEILKNSPASNKPGSVDILPNKESKSEQTSQANDLSNPQRDTSKLVQIEKSTSTNSPQLSSETSVALNTGVSPKMPTPPVQEQPKVKSNNLQEDNTTNSQKSTDSSIPKMVKVDVRTPSIALSSVNKVEEKSNNKPSETVSKSSPIPPIQGSQRTARKSIEQFTSSIRKPYREIEIKEQERGRYYIVFGHFTSKPNASHYARGIRKKYPETHLTPSKQGFRVLMDANQDAPVDHLRLVRTEYPKAWLSKPRKMKPEFEGN